METTPPPADTTKAAGSGAHDLSVSMVEASYKSLVFAIPPVIVIWGIYLLMWGWPRTSPGSHWGLYFAGAVLLGILAHEGIHGLVWALFGTRSFSSIRFGMNLRALTPYAHATVPMEIGPYRLGAFAPALILGILPSLYGIASGNLLATLFGIIFVGAAGGDMLVLWLIRGVPSDKFVKDHPTNAGCFVLDSLSANEPFPSE